MNLRRVIYVFSVLFYYETEAQAQDYDKHVSKICGKLPSIENALFYKNNY